MASKKGIDTFAGLYTGEKFENGQAQDGEDAVLKWDDPGERVIKPSKNRANSEEVDRSESREDKIDHVPEFSRQELQTAIV